MEIPSMDSSTQKTDKTKQNKPKSTMKKLDPASTKLLAQLKEKANKKDYGRKVLEKEILSFAVRLVTDEHLKELQAQTLSERDRLQMAHEDYQKANGRITLDQFIGKLLNGEISRRK